MSKNNDTLGDRMKFYENQTCNIRLLPLIPIVARLDGKGFSKFTKGLKKPYDENLSNLMIDTTKYLVKKTNANCGYTQSDEITLVWYNQDPKSGIYFGGRLFKILTELSAISSVYFNYRLPEFIPEKVGKLPTFDARAFNVPTLEEAVNQFRWREKDATKNSISMAAQSLYPHKFLDGKNSSDKQELIFSKGINWNDYPNFFKRGTYIQRKRVKTKFTTDEIEKLPKKHDARKNPDLEIERWVVKEINLEPINKIPNPVDVIIFGKEPILIKDEQ